LIRLKSGSGQKRTLFSRGFLSAFTFKSEHLRD
jgi:hypothetical protein